MRSALFVPGDDEKKLAKALGSGADALIVDLEDSVAPSAKERARSVAAEFLGAQAAQASRPRLFLRVNPLDSGLTDADLDAVMAAAPEGIVLPKSLDGASVQQLGVKLGVREALFGLADGATRIIAIATESARALFGMESYRACSARLHGLAWGGEDLSADLGAEGNRLPWILGQNGDPSRAGGCHQRGFHANARGGRPSPRRHRRLRRRAWRRRCRA
jgi:citrate lyase subunit beta/citryl-CoA lyase